MKLWHVSANKKLTLFSINWQFSTIYRVLFSCLHFSRNFAELKFQSQRPVFICTIMNYVSVVIKNQWNCLKMTYSDAIAIFKTNCLLGQSKARYTSPAQAFVIFGTGEFKEKIKKIFRYSDKSKTYIYIAIVC